MHNFWHASRHSVYLGAWQNLCIYICQNDLQFGTDGYITIQLEWFCTALIYICPTWSATTQLKHELCHWNIYNNATNWTSTCMWIVKHENYIYIYIYIYIGLICTSGTVS